MTDTIKMLGVLLTLLGLGGLGYISIKILLENLVPTILSVITFVVGIVLLYQD